MIWFNVLKERLSLILAIIPHLWGNYREWQSDDALATLCWRLKRLEPILRNDPDHPDGPERADQLLRFLDLIDAYQNPFARIPKPEDAESGFVQVPDLKDRRMRRVYRSNAQADAWHQRIQTLKEGSWKAAWKIYQQHSRSWWV